MAKDAPLQIAFDVHVLAEEMTDREVVFTLQEAIARAEGKGHTLSDEEEEMFRKNASRIWVQKAELFNGIG